MLTYGRKLTLEPVFITVPPRPPLSFPINLSASSVPRITPFCKWHSKMLTGTRSNQKFLAPPYKCKFSTEIHLETKVSVTCRNQTSKLSNFIIHMTMSLVKNRASTNTVNLVTQCTVKPYRVPHFVHHQYWQWSRDYDKLYIFKSTAPTQCQLMGLPHKSWQHFTGLHWDIVLCRHTYLFNEQLMLPFFPCQTMIVNCSTRILGMSYITVRSLFWAMIPFQNLLSPSWTTLG
jgi:hypothetical protein